MRPLTELVDLADPGWPLVRGWMAEGQNAVEILPSDLARAEATLLALQVTTRSPLGAVAYESGGMLVDRGWIRVLGSGCARMRGDLAWWNGLGDRPRADSLPGMLIVAYDVLGGTFAIDGGAIAGVAGEAYYFAPDSLAWETMNGGYSRLLTFFFQGDLDEFYKGYRWPGWEREIGVLPADEALSSYPPLWTKEGKDIAATSRRGVLMTEILAVNLDIKRQIDGGSSG